MKVVLTLTVDDCMDFPTCVEVLSFLFITSSDGGGGVNPVRFSDITAPRGCVSSNPSQYPITLAAESICPRIKSSINAMMEVRRCGGEDLYRCAGAEVRISIGVQVQR